MNTRRSNIKLLLAYDGTAYFGWQKNSNPSIEECLKKAVEQILQEKISLQAASRTDRGVHAKGQVVNFFTSREINPLLLKNGINALLPKDISVLDLTIVEDHFHPTLDAISKEYVYEVCNSPIQVPFFRTYSWHFPASLNLELMQEAAQLLIGSHDFSSFANERQKGERSLFRISIIPLDNGRFKIVVEGDRFLFKMVRNIVGTLIYIGCGKIEGDALLAILEGRDRTLAGVCAPAYGLTLNKVIYEPFKK